MLRVTHIDLFSEFWEDHFKCRYRGDKALNTPYNQHYDRNCSGNEKLTKENTQFEAQLQFVSDAVMAFAHAFRYTHYFQTSFIRKVKLS